MRRASDPPATHFLAGHILALNDDLVRVLDLYSRVQLAQGAAPAKSGLSDLLSLNVGSPRPAHSLLDDDMLADYHVPPAHTIPQPQQPLWAQAPATQPALLPFSTLVAAPAPAPASNTNPLSLDGLFGPAPTAAAPQTSALSSQLASLSFQTAAVQHSAPAPPAYQPMVPQQSAPAYQAMAPQQPAQASFAAPFIPMQPVATAAYTQPALLPSQPLVAGSASAAAAPNLAAINIPIQAIKPSDKPPVDVYNKNGLRILFHVAKDPPHPSLVVLVASYLNLGNVNITDFLFQAAVPKVRPEHTSAHRDLTPGRRSR